MEAPGLAGELTFKGGTSLSKAYGVIRRFSEDVDLTISRSAPLVDRVPPPMEAGISNKELGRRSRALKLAAQEFVRHLAVPALGSAIEGSLGSSSSWSLEEDPDDGDAQTLLFHYPRDGGGDDQAAGAGYIKPRIKLEFGARGEAEPAQARGIVPYVAEDFPDLLPDAATAVPTLAVERTFWEKVTILHALFHNGKLRAGMSRHYYDVLMLDEAGITSAALKRADLLDDVVRNKSIMFADRSASYESAVRGSLRLVPAPTMERDLRSDYSAMEDMFMGAPPAFDALREGLERIEAALNSA